MALKPCRARTSRLGDPQPEGETKAANPDAVSLKKRAYRRRIAMRVLSAYALAVVATVVIGLTHSADNVARALLMVVVATIPVAIIASKLAAHEPIPAKDDAPNAKKSVSAAEFIGGLASLGFIGYFALLFFLIFFYPSVAPELAVWFFIFALPCAVVAGLCAGILRTRHISPVPVIIVGYATPPPAPPPPE